MMNKFKNLFLLTLTLSILTFSAMAQTVGEGTIAASDSKLTGINLPSGARRVKDVMTPAEVGEVLRKLIEQGGASVRQGEREVLLWGGDYRGSRGTQMVKTLENNLKAAGWQYERAAEENGITIFVLLSETAQVKRGAVGFFAPSEEAFIFAVSEMLPADGGAVKQTVTGENAPNKRSDDNANEVPTTASNRNESSGGGSVPRSFVGRWLKSGGLGRGDDGTGKSTYSSGNDIVFEFRADGTMTFINEKKTLSITQCRIAETLKIPGTFSLSGDTLTMNLAAGTHVGTSSCERAGNFKKTVSASTLTKRFVVKRLESVFRPDAPQILCFDGASDDQCFERADQ